MSHAIFVEVIINADRKKTWEYYTNPTHIVNWNFADPSWHCPKAENNLKISGTYTVRMEAKDGSFGFDFEAVYTDVISGEQFTYQFGDRKATVVFDEIDNQTLLKITFDAETENSIEMQKNGWQAILNNFKNYVEAQ